MFVLFPDPWPKKRHSFRRLLSIEFLHLLTHHLKDKGDLIFGTDDKNYADWVEENLKQVSLLIKVNKNPKKDSWLSKIDSTYFEKKWEAEGRTIYYLWHQKVSS